MALSDSVVAFVFVGLGLILIFKTLERPGLKNKKPIPQQMNTTELFSNPRWGNFPGTADERGWIR